MGTRAKPESSYASTRLTRRNFSGKSLLTTFQNRDQDQTGEDEEIQEEEKEVKDEPAPKIEMTEEDINAPPLDDSDDAQDEDNKENVLEDSSEDEKKPRIHKKTFEEKLAENNEGPRRSTRGSQSFSIKEDPDKQDSSQKSNLTRTASQMDDDREGIVFSQISPSNKLKRQRQMAYGSRNNQPYKPPRSNKIFSSSADTQSQDAAKSKSTSNSQENKSPKVKAEGFIVPREVIPEYFTKNQEPPAISQGSSFVKSSSQDLQVADSVDESELSSALSEVSSIELFDMEQEQESKLSLCPLCKEPVDPGLLLVFKAQQRQRLRDQERFCQSHKETSAEDEWQQKGYPDIDWINFEERLHGHFADLEKNVLVPECSSYFRNILDSSLKSGQAKNFRLTMDSDLESISCGYYGPKGAGRILQTVTTRFSPHLRRLARSDHIVKTAGIAGYAQSVLVPELALRLIKEDMNVNDESARQILRESMEIGNRLNPVVDDVVPVSKEEPDQWEMAE